MMQTTTMPDGLSGLLSQILGGLDASGSQLLGGSDGTEILGQADVGEFVQSLAGQLKSLMVQRGEDPTLVAAIDDKTLAAEFFALIQGKNESLTGGLSGVAGLGELMRGFEVPAVPEEEDRVSGEISPSDAPEQESETPVWLAALPIVVLERLNEAGRILPTPASEPAGPPDSAPVDLETLTRAFLRQVMPSAAQAAAAPAEPANPSESPSTDLEALTRALLRQVAPAAAQDAAAPAEPASPSESPSTDLEALTRALLRQVTPSTVQDAERPETPDTLKSAESASVLPSWLVRQLNSDGTQTWLNTSTSANAAANADGDPPSVSLGETLKGLTTSGKHRLEATSDLEAVLESRELTDSAPTITPRTPTATTETATIGARPQTLDLNRLLQPGGEQRLAEQVRWSVEQGLETAEIKLHPPSLGALDVRLVQEGDKTHVQFVSAHPITREVLEAAVPRLRDALAQDGVLLGNVSVSDQAPNDRGETGREHGQSAGAGDLEAEEDEDRIESRGTLSVLSRRLDVFT
jgi:flagellar hook-length control protein FliK